MNAARKLSPGYTARWIESRVAAMVGEVRDGWVVVEATTTKRLHGWLHDRATLAERTYDANVAVVECVECAARCYVSTRELATNRRLPVCDHPVVDDATPYENDALAQSMVWHGPLTLEQIGDLMNVSRERVRQIEFVAMRRLRAACAREGIRIEEVLGGRE